MFADLRETEKNLTDRPLPAGDTTEHDIGHGLSFSITVSMGPTKKDGFEHLREVVTRYRRAWAEEHLEHYLQARWQQDLRAVGDAYHRHVADKAKPPTLKQFAKLAEQAANHWFGGDLAQLSNALGLVAPDSPKYNRLLPVNRAEFVARVRELLGGQPWGASPEDMDRDERERRLRRSELADHAPAAVQIWEATGEPPPLKGASWARYRLETAFGADIEAGWEQYLDAIKQTIRDGTPTQDVAADPERPNPAMQPDVQAIGPPKLSKDRPLQPETDHGIRGLLSRMRR
jgi:hypothetical protein